MYHIKQISETDKAVKFKANFGFVTDPTLARKRRYCRPWCFWVAKSLLNQGVPPEWVLKKEDLKAREYYGFELFDQNFGLDLFDAMAMPISEQMQKA